MLLRTTLYQVGHVLAPYLQTFAQDLAKAKLQRLLFAVRLEIAIEAMLPMKDPFDRGLFLALESASNVQVIPQKTSCAYEHARITRGYKTDCGNLAGLSPSPDDCSISS